MRISDWSSDVCSSDLVGFDAVSTAAEETKNPQRNVPIGLIASLGICTIFYLLVAAGAIGAIGAQPVVGTAGEALMPGSTGLAAQCQSLAAAGTEPLVCSREALAHVLRSVGHVQDRKSTRLNSSH